MHDVDLESPSTLHPLPRLTLTQRRSRRPPRVSFAALAQAARQRRRQEENETGLEDERREGETGLRGEAEAQIASCTAPLCQPYQQSITALAHRSRLLIRRPMHCHGLLRRPMLFEIYRGSKNCIINP